MACDNVLSDKDGPLFYRPGGTRPDARTEPWLGAVTRRCRAVMAVAGTVGCSPAWLLRASGPLRPPPTPRWQRRCTPSARRQTRWPAWSLHPPRFRKARPILFVVKFRATAQLSGSGAGRVTITTSTPWSSVPGNVALIDDSDTACFQAGTNGGAVSGTTLQVNLAASCNVAVGDEVEVDFTASARVRSVTSPSR